MAPPEQRFSDAAMEERFADPKRKQKLVDALSDMDAVVKEAGERLGLPGLYAGVVIDGALAKSASTGFRDVAASAPVDDDTLFRIGSITKPFTATVLMKLRDQGKLELDVPAERYLPELSHVRYPTHDSPRITLRQLLSHSAGLPRNGSYDSSRTDRDVTEAEVLASLDDLPLEYSPGTSYRYSNFGFSLLGLVIARVAKLPYRQAMRALLFTPLGMTSAGFDPDQLEQSHLARSYGKKDGTWLLDEHYERLGASEADGGLYVSGRDFAKFVAWELAAYPPRDDLDSGPLRRASVREMHVPERLTLLRVSAPDSGDPWVSKTRAFGVGLAWHTLSTCDFEHVVHHDGLVDHYASSVALYPDYGVGVFLFTNGGSADLGGIGNELVQRMQKSGALTQRVRVATRAPQLDAAMDRLLAVMHRWDAQRYAAMLSAPHQQNVKAEDERAELAGYLALHGDCTRGAITQFVGPTEARYALQCQRGQLEMWLRLEAQSGLIAGFSGVSKGVAETPGSRAAAKKALALFHRWSAQGFSSLFAPSFLSEKETRDFAAKYDARHGVCSLGDAIERDGNGWQRFAVSCQHGNDVLSIKLEKDRITGLLLRPKDTDARCEAR